MPTTDRSHGISDPVSKLQVDTLDANCDKWGVTQFKMNDLRQGIVHVIGPEQGATLPGMTVVCGDSHTSTHGAFGALAHGIGTSEVEHVLATQTLLARKAKNLLVNVEGKLSRGCSAKDIALAIIGTIGTAGGTGYTIEFAGSAIRALSMEGRMTVCNMAIEAGARAGLVGVDETTMAYVKGRPYSPAGLEWETAVRYWKGLRSDPGAHWDRVVEIDAGAIVPQVTWGTSPEMVASIGERVPDPEREKDAGKRDAIERALEYMALTPNQRIDDIRIDKVFIGSCTNSRIEDLREAAAVVRRLGGRIAGNVKLAMVVPGSGLVKQQAEQEGLDAVFKAAGFEWREPGCSMSCHEPTGGRASGTSTSGRIRGRQGAGGHSLGQPGDGGGGRDRGPFRRRPPSGLKMSPSAFTPAWSRRWTGKRRHRRDHSQAVPEVDQEVRVRPELSVRRVALPRSRRAGQDRRAASPTRLRLNQPRSGRLGLLARKNFGCVARGTPLGAAAVGFRALIAPSYADISSKLLQNGLLPIVLPERQVATLFDETATFVGYRRRSTSSARWYQARRQRAGFEVERFAVPARRLRRHRLTLRHADTIRAFEAERLLKQPWLATTIR